MLPERNKILDEEFVNDLAEQVYNTTKILYCLKEEEREKVIAQLVKDFLKPYIKNKDHVITKESSGSEECIPE